MRTKSSFHRPVVDALFLTFLVASLAFLFKRKKNRQPASSSTSAAALLDSTVDSSLEDAADAAFVAGGDANALAAEWARNSAEAAEVEDTARRFFATGGDGSTLLGSALRHALTLHRMCLDAESGISAENLPAKYGRFFGSQGLVQQIRKWPSVRVARAVSILAEAVNRTRREPNLNEAIAVRALWSVALAARARS